MYTPRLTLPHVLLALLVAAIWGVAFVFTKLGLDSFSPPLLTALRFAVSALPLLVVPRPRIPWRLTIALGLTLFVGQFMFLFLGITHGIPPGLAAVILQTQSMFTVALAAAIFRQYPTGRQTAALAVAAAGLACIAATVGEEFDATALGLMLLSPLSFAVGNLLLRRVGHADMVALMSWLSLVPPLPCLALALALDGPEAIGHSLAAAPWIAWVSVVFLGFAGTTIAFAAWGQLLRRYGVATIAPFALLVPFIGAVASSLVFGEQFGPLRLAGMGLVLAGLAVLLVPSSRRRTRSTRPPA
ncbi:MAG: EamA family transporter [Rhodoplanes sp.]|uniref:EamA family transporter n=1 Tax=Rhodoplanes sp. TaxID=1968906 RepID=UPI001844B3AE|nr:EamA family transporter [Rhodoplanes sp.]NVO15743.1 EamA family transporter [Rhodoplanes sp.]